MTNNLRGIRKGLCAFAKKCKGFKYTDSALITFLITGGISISNNVFSAENDSSIESQKKIISTDIKDFNILVKETRKENNKLIKKTNFELVKLMEQGDHVVKSPWASWQTGTNYMYNNWNGTYKGRGNKIKDEVLTRDTTGNLNKFLETGLNSTSYGSTNLGIVHEPPAIIKMSALINPKIIERNIPSYSASTPEVTYPTFDPRYILSPVKPSAPAEITPTTFDPPDIKYKGSGFHQWSQVGMPKLVGHNVVIQNYDTYDTVSKTDGTTKGIFNIEVGKLSGGARVRWWGANLDGTANPDIQMKGVTNVPNVATPGVTVGGQNPGGPGTHWLDDGEVTTRGMNAFINELRDHDATISGNYVLTNRGGENNGGNRIFLSHNPASLGSAGYDGLNRSIIRTATFDGNLTLHGTPTPYTGTGAHSDVTIGVEHQHWTNTKHDVYSIFNNTGNITLASGNNLVGILIDIERNYSGENASAHKTINSGKIEIENAENSIAIDYGEYETWVFK